MKFEKKFVHCMYDEELVGKTCVFADDMPSLRVHVIKCDDAFIGVLQAPPLKPGNSVDELMYPFYRNDDNECYKFIYYDPNLECKIAYEQGKMIQYFDSGEWFDVVNPVWNPDIEYRVKPIPDDDKYVPYESVTEMLCDNFNVDNVEDIKNCIWLRSKADTSIRFMITGTDVNQVMVDSTWLTPSELLDDYLWDDYTVIGK